MLWLGFLGPFVLLALSLAFTAAHLLDVANFPTVVTFVCLELAVFGKRMGAVSVVISRGCPSMNDHDTGTWQHGALLLSYLQFLDILVCNFRDLA